MTRSACQCASGRAAGLRSLACALLAIIELSGASVFAQPFRTQTVPPGAPSLEARQAFQTSIGEQARLLASNPRLRNWPQHEREALVEFVAGNVLFAALQHLGLALLSDLSLPALGGVSQGADDFAVLTALELGKSYFSDRILMEAAKSRLTSMRRKKTATGASRYEQGLDLRRAYRMVCLMSGADAARFKAVAEETALSKNLQRNCGWDYDSAVRSWETLLRPHRPRADQPKTRIDVSYGAASGSLAIYAQIFRNLKFLETIAEVIAGQVTWRAPFLLEMRSCGTDAATWDASARTLSVCYETAEALVELYRSSEQGRR